MILLTIPRQMLTILPSLSHQVSELFILAIPVACISWTITHEEIFKGPRDFCTRQCKQNKSSVVRKFFYLFTCEYCFSHYISLAVIFLTNYHLLFSDWKGYIIGGLSLVWIANVYMSLYGLLRMDIKKEKTIIKEKEKDQNA